MSRVVSGAETRAAMRILATNPDTIGDVVLRQPLYRALIEAGHELTLVIRPLLSPVIGSIAPGAGVIQCETNLYNPRLSMESAGLEAVVEAAREFDPDLLLVAPYQWTVLEERLSTELPRARCVAMSGRLFADPTFGPPPASRLRVDQRVQVAEDAPEVRKSQLLAGAALGRAVSLPDPKIEAAAEHLQAAAAHLARLGLDPGGYWVACVGDSSFTRVRNWGVARWSEALSALADGGRKFLLVGHESERETTLAVRAGMGDKASSVVEWSGAGDGDLDVLLGLIAQSAGYLGRDTGPMHLAAALGKPVLAVFGGGTWPRFLPAVDPSVSLAVGVPCVGCGWVCHLAESYCIKEVPVAEVLRAAEDLERGRVARREARLLKPDAALLAKVGREGAASARERLTQLSVTRRQSMEQNDSLAAVLERALKQAGRSEALAEALDATRAEMARREGVLKQRLAAAENLFRTREEEMSRRLAALERTLAGRSPEDQVAAKADERARGMTAELHARLHQLQADLARTQAELLEARAEASDSKLKLSRLETERGTLATLTRQQEGEVVVLRGRLNELLASRWRRYGQKLHLCMTMPWEREMGNGEH
jgi:ADP-heptose:LPS heptosyltransferase